jgi:hypothetical protein
LSGFVNKLKDMFAKKIGQPVAGALEDRLTSERTEQTLDRMPGGDTLRDRDENDKADPSGGGKRGFGGERE